MAKALFGHIGTSPDQRLVVELRRLRARVTKLEGDLARAHDALAATVSVEDDLSTLSLDRHEPALT